MDGGARGPVAVIDRGPAGATFLCPRRPAAAGRGPGGVRPPAPALEPNRGPNMAPWRGPFMPTRRGHGDPYSQGASAGAGGHAAAWAQGGEKGSTNRPTLAGRLGSVWGDRARGRIRPSSGQLVGGGHGVAHGEARRRPPAPRPPQGPGSVLTKRAAEGLFCPSSAPNGCPKPPVWRF